MKYIILLMMLPMLLFARQQEDAAEIIRKVDANMTAETTESKSKMVIYGRRETRTVTAHSYARGDDESFTEYLSPPREQGTKMLKLKDRLWIYSPSTDRTVQISGHMLRQSVMGSDMSYEDVMEDRELLDIYNAKILGEETLQGRKVWLIKLTAKVDDATYETRKSWIDKERYVPLKEELFAKSGKLLKRVEMSEVKKYGNRWYPTKMNYKDVLKEGKGTDFILTEIKFNEKVPVYIFSKAALKK